MVLLREKRNWFKMFLYYSARNRNPNKFLCNFINISFFTSQSSSSPNNKAPPRKGRQAVLRIHKLLSLKQTQNPNLSETLKTLESSPETLSSSQASTLITAIANPLISFDFYRFLRSSKPIFKPESILYASLIKSQLQSINPHLPRIQYYFDEMKKNRISLSRDDLCSLFDLVIPNSPQIGEFLISEVLEKIEFDEGSYSYVISVYGKHGFCKEAILVAEKARVRFRNPSLGFYSSVMDVYGVNGDARAAMKLVLEMEERGVLADEAIYRVLLGILYRVGWVKLCWVLVEEMKQVGYKPDECLARNLMKMFIKEGMISEAGFFVTEGILKDEESLAMFGEAMTEKGKSSVALEFIQKVGESGCNVDGSVFASTIRGCGNMGLVNDAEKIFGMIKTLKGVKNQELVYSSMVYVYSRAEMRKMAETIMNEMEVTTGFTGSVDVFLYMMSMYRALGLVTDVVRIFDSWKKSGCLISIDAYVVLIDALSKSSKLNQARDFLLEMRSSGIRPTNSIYASIMEGYLLVGLINHAIALFDEYKVSGLELDEVIAGSVLRVLIQSNRYLELRFYLDKLMKQGIKISRDKEAFLLEMCKDEYCLRKLSQLLQ